MFTSATTKRCECFVWAQPARGHSDKFALNEGMNTARPWYYGAPDPRERGENSRPRLAASPERECGPSSAAGLRGMKGEGGRAPQPAPAPLAWDPPSGYFAANAGFTLLEVMVASAVALLVLLVVVSLSWYSGRSFVAIANYVDLDQASQLALDKMSREIRQAHRVTDYSPTSLSLLDVDSNPLSFIYAPDARTLGRVRGGLTNVLLTGCDFLQFAKYQHTAISNTFDAYDPAYVTNTRLIEVTWKCSRQILGAKANTESVQSAKIALRNN